MCVGGGEHHGNQKPLNFPVHAHSCERAQTSCAYTHRQTDTHTHCRTVAESDQFWRLISFCSQERHIGKEQVCVCACVRTCNCVRSQERHISKEQVCVCV